MFIFAIVSRAAPGNVQQSVRPTVQPERENGHLPIILLSITNKMQRYTIFFITVSALPFAGSFSARHQELKNCTHSIWYVPGLLLPLASLAHTRCCVYSS